MPSFNKILNDLREFCEESNNSFQRFSGNDDRKEKQVKQPDNGPSSGHLYDKEMERLIDLAITDGTLSEKEKQVLFKKAQAKGIELDEFEMVLDARLCEHNKSIKKETPVNVSAPKSNKLGDIRKCPSCGAIVKAFSPVCSECGYEFTNIEASLSYERLSEKLSSIDDPQKRVNLIMSFPIPNAKADLFDFLTSAKPHITDTSDIYRSAYWKKYQECMEKASISFRNDDIFRPFFDSYPKLKRKVLVGNCFSWFRHLHWAWKVIIIFLTLMIIISIFQWIGSLFIKPNA